MCEAAGPWGLITTIEGLMAGQAEKSVSSFLVFCTARCKGEPFAEDKGEPFAEYASDVEFAEEFLDAAETLSIASSGDLGGGPLCLATSFCCLPAGDRCAGPWSWCWVLEHIVARCRQAWGLRGLAQPIVATTS